MTNEKKGIGEILSEALDIIGKNPIIIVLYLIPVILSLIGILTTVGVFFQQGMMQPGFRGFEVDPEYFLGTALSFLGLISVFGILSWIFGVVIDAFAIRIAYNATQGKKLSLSEVWNEIGAGKILILLIASIIVTLLTILGFFVFCIGALIVMILLIFVKQGIVVDDLDLGTAFSRSYSIAKENFFEVLILVLVFLVLGLVVGLVPWIGGLLSVFVGMYAIVAYTVLYLDRK
ncbi:MAG: hypothetical protein HXS52_07300 [Theionarchaea archaeon]|nr:hypothetical protein [Theionarchaea archaeon]MBU7037722.1 hypothetical protein [Theionarchaea archaeon]